MLAMAVEKFVNTTLHLPDDVLNTKWEFGSYNSEGIRFGHFRVFEELQSLAVKLRRQREPMTDAQRILGQYHAAYKDLQAVLLGINDETGAKPPAEGEWSAQKALAHIVQADIGFYCVIRHGVEQVRAGVEEPVGLTEEDYDRMLPDLDDAAYRALSNQPISKLQAIHAQWHTKILRKFAEITDAELEMKSVFWEKEKYPNRFRLHRFDAHMRQHTIQIEKTLIAVGADYTEAKRLHRLIYGALAEVENLTTGADDIEKAGIRETAKMIDDLAVEFAEIVG